MHDDDGGRAGTILDTSAVPWGIRPPWDGKISSLVVVFHIFGVFFIGVSPLLVNLRGLAPATHSFIHPHTHQELGYMDIGRKRRKGKDG